MKVLVIEDDPTLIKNIAGALSSENLQVELVYDGLLEERLVKTNLYACIVMDIYLPGKNGFDLCKGFREIKEKTPVIMLTAFGELEDKVKGFDCGADDYLTKPDYMRDLVIRINALVKRANGKESSDIDT